MPTIEHEPGKLEAFSAIPIEIDVDTELWERLVQYARSELDRHYTRTVSRQGQRLFPLALASLYMAGDELEAEVVDRQERHKVKMTLPVFDWESGYSYIACSCQRESLHLEDQRCAHMWLVQKALLVRLEAALEKQKAEAADQHAPSQLRQVLDSFLADDAEKELASQNLALTAEDQQNQRIVWFLQDDLQVEARLQRQHLGRWSSGRLLSWSEFLEQKELWLDSHYRVASFLTPEPKAGGLEFQADHLAILKSILEENLVFWASDSSKTVEFIQESLILRADVREEMLRLQPCLGRHPISVADETEGLLFAVAKSEAALYYCQTDSKTAKLVQQILFAEDGLPVADQAIMLDYMLRLNQRQLPVALDEKIKLPTQEAAQQLILRLTPFANGNTKLEMLFKPADGYYFPPASGPEKILSQSKENETVSVIRDFFFEDAKARQVAERLSLMQYAFRYPASWFLPGADAVLNLLEAVQSWPSSELLIEWPKNDPSLSQAWRLGPRLDSQKIILRVGEKKDWLAVQGQIEIDGEEIDLAALIKALRENRQYIALQDGRWAKITEALQARLEHINNAIDEEDEQFRINPAAMDELLQLEEAEALVIDDAVEKWRKLRQNFQAIRVLDETVAQEFKAQLRPYQLEGYRWMHRLCVWGMGACLADDMGLGKTIQTLAVLLKHQHRGPSLVIAPSSVIANWSFEAKRFCPSLEAIVYRETDRKSPDVNFHAGQIVLISYGLVLRDRERLAKQSWNIVVIDEAQTIKNAKSQTAKAIQSLTWRWALALSGTPIENHLGDLWSLFRTISPGLLGSWQHFRRAYGFPILNGDSKARERLKRRIQPFILRRLKADYLKELPPKIEVDLRVSLSDEERQVYEAIRLDALAQLSAEADSEDNSNDKQQRMKILGALTRMRLAICHPKLVKSDWQLGSAKLELLKTLMEPIRANDHRVLIFSQFTRFLSLVRDFLSEQGLGPLAYLDGQTPVEERGRLVEGFQQGTYPIFLISLKAGGTGLNLTKADMVLHLDPWWNPAVEDQATDRAYRMGQTQQVMVYRFIAEATIEEQILQLHSEKRQLANALLAQDGAALSQLSNDQLIAMIKNH